MWFIGQKTPELFRVEFHCGNPREFSHLQQQATDKENRFTFQESAKALSLLFLEYRCAGLEGRGDSLTFPGSRTGSLAASLKYALDKEGKIPTLFTNFPASGGEEPYANAVFGENEQAEERQIFVKSDCLAPDCVEIYWNDVLLNEPVELRELNTLIREASTLEPSRQPPPPPNPPPPGKEPKQPDLLSKEPEPPQAPKSEVEPANFSGLLNRAVRALERIATKPAEERTKAATTPRPADEKKPDPEHPPKGEPKPEPVGLESEIPRPEPKSPLPIDPQFFTVPPSNGIWPDETPLIELPDGETSHIWTLKNAFEGVLILGRTGSGKTSGSGVTFAEAFLRSGFGGLVLTVKSGEAEYWQRLCEYCGRANDLVIVRRGGNWKLNILAYEAQHPGRDSGIAENFTSFCRNLLRISTRSKGGGSNEEIWERAGDQLLTATFDLFLLAGGNITFDRLADFVAAAPTETLPTSNEAWLKIPVFGSVFLEAKSRAKSPEDQRIFYRATDYWFKFYAVSPSKFRSSLMLAISGIFDAFRGRDIPALISSETNVTPESIMGGKIVVLDLPLKELHHTGLMVQSAWKYLFQIALERQRRANNQRCRPVFLWEDEGQHFHSQHDHHFQATARSARVSRVILTQNLHSFYQEFGEGGRHAADTVFSNLNTKVFHNNSDPLTNEWAAKQFGMELTNRVTINQNPPQTVGVSTT